MERGPKEQIGNKVESTIHKSSGENLNGLSIQFCASDLSKKEKYFRE